MRGSRRTTGRHSKEGKGLAEETPDVWQIRDIDTDGRFSKIPELIATVEDVDEREDFGCGGADNLGG
jgi:hypothetical protein